MRPISQPVPRPSGKRIVHRMDQIALVSMASEMLVPLDEIDIYVAKLTMCLASICAPSEHRTGAPRAHARMHLADSMAAHKRYLRIFAK